VRAIDAAIRIWSINVAQGSNEYRIRLCWVDEDAADLSSVVEPDLFPRLAFVI
jgi:hypothetical protein